MQRSPIQVVGGRHVAEDPDEARGLVEERGSVDHHDQRSGSFWASDRSLYYKILVAVAVGTLALFAVVTVAGLSKDGGLGGSGLMSGRPHVVVLPSVSAAAATSSKPEVHDPPGRVATGPAADSDRQPADVPLLHLKEGWHWNKYHSLEDMLAFMVWLANTAPELCRTYTIGSSVQGHEIRAVELGPRGAEATKFRPAVKLSAGQHGDEPASMELLLRLAWHLVASYGREPRVTALLKSTAVHVLPVINPDGLVAKTRNNANGADLNRNFPLESFPYAKPGPTKGTDSQAVQHWREAGDKPLQPENAAIIAWARSVPSVLSGNAHGGALVTNYPFDACDQAGEEINCPTPEDPLPHFIASLYASNHPEMRHNQLEGFTNGTTRGSQWYPVMGSMQDWLYHNTDSLDLTFELHDIKTPPESYLATMWVENLPALLRFCEAAHIGVLGRMQDEGAAAAEVEVVAPVGSRHVTIGTGGQQFFKLLAPMQQYCLRVKPRGYAPVLLAVRVPLEPDAVIRGTGLQGLTVEAVVPTRAAGGPAGEVLTVGGADKAVCSAAVAAGAAASGAR